MTLATVVCGGIWGAPLAVKLRVIGLILRTFYGRGDTLFVNMCAAYDALSPVIKDLAHTLQGSHDLLAKAVFEDALRQGDAETIQQIHNLCPDLGVEVLVPDFKADVELIEVVCVAKPDVYAHNIETVESLQKHVRPQCRYDWSLKALTIAAQKFGMVTKSSMMLGHGETRDEVIQTLRDLRQTGCRMVSIGQYLQPTRAHLEVKEYVLPDVFAEYKHIGEDMGFDHVESAPLVRSSFRADQQANAAGIV